jgi:hypothetical protein
VTLIGKDMLIYMDFVRADRMLGLGLPQILFVIETAFYLFLRILMWNAFTNIRKLLCSKMVVQNFWKSIDHNVIKQIIYILDEPVVAAPSTTKRPLGPKRPTTTKKPTTTAEPAGL